MKIGVISDTHLSRGNELLKKTIERYFKDADLILHAGDLVSLEVLDTFKDKKVVAVSGNMDSREVRQKLPEREVVEAAGFRIGLIHGWGSPNGLEIKVAESFKNVDCVVFGHSHRGFNKIINGVLLFNPGAFSSSFFSTRDSSIGLLNIGEKIEGEIIKI